ncbi:MAG: pirin family protein [Planctomycetaceae bacterium]|nr:pirin family protein [Planctomycetaceae bacterium]
MITVRDPKTIYIGSGGIENGTFAGRWHFSFGPYHDPQNMHFGRLRVFNDDTLSPGAVWPLHEHHEIEVVTYCAGGVFRHADQNGVGDILKKGWVQHTTVGVGMWHSEINDSPTEPMRFIQMWFIPSQSGLAPSVEQRQIDIGLRTNRLCLLVSESTPGSLKMYSPAGVYSCFLQKDKSLWLPLRPGHGGYLYIVEGGPVKYGDGTMAELAAAKVTGQPNLNITAIDDAELLWIDTAL